MNLLDLIFPKTCLECGKEGKYICDDCLAKVGRYGMHNNVLSIFKYEGVIRKAIIALKYKFSTEVAKELADICVGSLKKMSLKHKKYLLMPIPLHWHRQNIRGFNQAEEIGKLVAMGMGWEYNSNLLVKKISTKPQVGLTSSTRRENLKGVFSLNYDYSVPKNGLAIIFDDVVTTGSTLGEAVKVLNRAGIKKVMGMTIAR